MKKFLCIFVFAALLVGTVGGVGAYALGSGYEAVAKDVTMIKTGLTGQRIGFSDADFKCATCLKDFKSLTVVRLPKADEGTLMLGINRVEEGQSIKRRSLAALTFIPKDNGVREASFGFIIDGQPTKSETNCLLKFIDRVNLAPEIQDSVSASEALSTQSGISLYSRLSATDPEGDELEFIIVAYPKKGALTFVNKEEGRYKYAPEKDFTGYDSFTYVVRDCYGNYSAPVNIEIKVTERMSDTVYRDMTNREEYGAAVAMCALGIMNGKIIGDGSYFCPEETVSRAEFVSYALKAMGIGPDEKTKVSFFDDRDSIPSSLLGYVVKAEKMGIVDGNLEDGALKFRPNESITVYEAAEIIARLTGVKTENIATSFKEVPVFARAAVGAMIDMGVLAPDTDFTLKLSKAQAAEMLYNTIKLL